jgi:hypothetical protein
MVVSNHEKVHISSAISCLMLAIGYLLNQTLTIAGLADSLSPDGPEYEQNANFSFGR